MILPAPLHFAVAFTSTMRKAKWVRYVPTLRTATALARLLIVRKLREGHLKGEDYIECARLVTPPEDCDAAEETAIRLLSAPTPFPKAGIKPGAETSALAQILAEMKLAEAADCDAPLEETALGLEDLLTDPDFKELLDEVGGIESARARFSGKEELIEAGRNLVRDNLGALSPSLFAQAVKMGLADEIAGQSSGAAESLAAKVVLGESDAASAMDQAGGFAMQQKLLEYLRSARVEVRDQIQALADRAQTVSDLASVSEMAHVEIDRNRLLEAIKNAMPEHSFEELFEATEQFSAEMAEAARNALYEGFPDLTEEQLSQNAQLSAQWKQALDRAVRKRAETAAGSTYDEGLAMLRDLHAVARAQGDPVLSQHLMEGIKGAAEGVASRVGNFDELLELIQTTDNMGCHLSPGMLRDHGRRVGLSDYEIDQLLRSRLAVIKKMIEEGEKVYERFSYLINREAPSPHNTLRLAEMALRKRNTAALAALGHYDLNMTLQAAEKAGGGHKLVLESLTAGPGSNLLVQWFHYRNKVPESVKEPLRKLAKEVLLQYAVSLGKSLVGDRSRGLLEGEQVRAYVPGDDPSLVDLEETLDHMVTAGKPLSMLDGDDIRVRKTTHGRRAVAMLIDISGSMEGNKLTWCAIAAAMLAYALQPDELSLAFFESDTHIVKRFDEEMSIEEIADALLNLASMGGTMLSTGLTHVASELRSVEQKHKTALVLTDAAIYDLEQCAPACRMLAALHTRAVWFVPQDKWAEDGANTLAAWSRGAVVRLHENWRRFPDLISEALR